MTRAHADSAQFVHSFSSTHICGPRTSGAIFAGRTDVQSKLFPRQNVRMFDANPGGVPTASSVRRMSKIASRILHGISATSCVLVGLYAMQPSRAVAQTAPTQDRPI